MKRTYFYLIACFSIVFLILLVTSCGKGPPENHGTGETDSSRNQSNSGGPAEPIGQAPAAENLQGKKLWKAVEKSMDRGLKYLRILQKDGKWELGGKPEPGVTALVVGAFLGSHRKYSLEEPFIRLPLEYLASLARDDGSIYAYGNANYVTSVAVQALAFSGLEKYKPLIEKSRAFLEKLQSDEEEGYRPGDRGYGGGGYGGDERPDLSNTSFWMEGLQAAGTEKGSESFQKALVFLNRCHNYSEVNKEEWTNREGVSFVPGNDGGGIYAPGDSKAGYILLANGKRVPRSYGSMTYSLLKCYIFAGLEKSDPRVQAAFRWIGRNFTVDENPGFETMNNPTLGQQGLYYYYLAMAKALHLHGDEQIYDEDEAPHRWREELARKIISLQNPDGSWVNKNPRWYENLPEIVTSYAILALQHCYAGKNGAGN